MRFTSRRVLVPSLAAAALAGTASAQQFTFNPSTIPGTPRWTEGVEASDIDNDGDLDLWFADGEGFSSPGTQRVNKVITNTLELGGGFLDESFARLGNLQSHAKMVVAADVNADGWSDSLFANAFNTDPPFLYINRGAAQPGFFDEQGATRGLTAVYSSASANFGDLDNDGDLDLIISDSGSSFLGGSGDRPHLYFNDGAGNFTEDALALGAPVKKAHMDVQLIDIDNDWDLDFFGPNRASNTGGNHYLMINDGSGNFTNASSLVPNGSSNVYEADVADLDGDTDLDMFFVSLGGFTEGGVRNDLVETGSLAFSQGPLLSSGDDNEVAMLDFDVDGDMDALVGALFQSREKAFRNNGSGLFTEVVIFQNISDSTLDMEVADLDNDGRYDVITAQGESNSAQWVNKVYYNSGPVDSLPPVVNREETLSSPSGSGPWVVRAQVQDQVVDDGETYVEGRASYVINTATATAAVGTAGFDFSPAVISVPAGTTVTWTMNPADPFAHTVTSTTPGYGFDSGTLNPGDTFSYTFVEPGTYDYVCTPHASFGMTGQVIVTAAANAGSVDGLDVNGGMFRFEMTDLGQGFAKELCYELHFTDWAGNETVTQSVCVPLAGCGYAPYGPGLGGANVLGLSGNGSPSVGGSFSLTLSGLATPSAFVGYSLGQFSLPVLGGTLLLSPAPLLQTVPVAVAGSTATFTAPVPNNPAFTGLELFFQGLGIDPGQAAGIAFSNGVQAVVCP
jgi:plastocyanin